ncbi:class I SAM-dependent methyltransferase [Confluentibacter citreus]|uniref:hypothetical protein n=1 Tax=Confluentibacter citreus TaxID=2007307 RepID=UPI000C28D145|nr:hypothetical protein [Confluentibacter citreus]
MNLLKKLFTYYKKNKYPISHGKTGIKEVGHRTYVGGLWDEIGKLQFEFLINNGLKPSDIFMDIACGSLRAGIHLIPYLNEGNYLGIDKEEDLINLGISKELDNKWLNIKKPELLISNSFEFNKFSKVPNFAIAQSLFTHLPPDLINFCFKKLSFHFDKKGVFFATYFVSEKKHDNPKKAHDHGIFKYTIEEIKSFGYSNGWDVEFIGDWNHPRNQQIVKYTLKNI